MAQVSPVSTLEWFSLGAGEQQRYADKSTDWYSEDVMTVFCPSCGRSLDEHDRHIRFGVPEPVLSIPEEARAALTWGNDVLMRVEGIGGFVRILVPVKLSGGYTVTYGAWLSVESDDLRRAWEVWTKPSYEQLRLRGVLANMLPGWESETYAKPVEAAVLNRAHALRGRQSR